MSLPDDAQGRKGIPLATGFVDYFPSAIVAVAALSAKGNDQHNPGQSLHWDRSKSGDEADALFRHFLQRGTVDVSDGVLHSTKVAWRALAMLQKELEASGAPIAPGAKNPPKGGPLPLPTQDDDRDSDDPRLAEYLERGDEEASLSHLKAGEAYIGDAMANGAIRALGGDAE